jgi:hypothetical protein
MAGRRGDVMRLLIAVVAVLVLCGCAAQNEISKRQREAESNAPDLSFQGPLRPMNLSAAQIKLVQQGIAGSLKDPASASFGNSYQGRYQQGPQDSGLRFRQRQEFRGDVCQARGWFYRVPSHQACGERGGAGGRQRLLPCRRRLPAAVTASPHIPPHEGRVDAEQSSAAGWGGVASFTASMDVGYSAAIGMGIGRRPIWSVSRRRSTDLSEDSSARTRNHSA